MFATMKDYVRWMFHESALCPDCRGHGYIDDSFTECPRCDGKGRLPWPPKEKPPDRD